MILYSDSSQLTQNGWSAMMDLRPSFFFQNVFTRRGDAGPPPRYLSPADHSTAPLTFGTPTRGPDWYCLTAPPPTPHPRNAWRSQRLRVSHGSGPYHCLVLEAHWFFGVTDWALLQVVRPSHRNFFKVFFWIFFSLHHFDPSGRGDRPWGLVFNKWVVGFYCRKESDPEEEEIEGQ